jgi:hypothetical protein
MREGSRELKAIEYDPMVKKLGAALCFLRINKNGSSTTVPFYYLVNARKCVMIFDLYFLDRNFEMSPQMIYTDHIEQLAELYKEIEQEGDWYFLKR